MTRNKQSIKVRHAESSDIEGLIDVELDRYAQLYKEKPKSREEIRELFQTRFSIAREWMWVVTLSGEVVGFITGQPTNEKPEGFTSWEKSTNNGTLENTYIPNGRNLYVVNLDVLRKATKINGQYMLMAQLGSAFIKHNMNVVFFESRMPNFRDWVYNESNIGQKKWNSMSENNKLEIAQQYSRLKVEKDGKRVCYDRLLRFYADSGFSFKKIAPNAFNDGESLNFGVVCEARNPLPKVLRFWGFRHVVASIFSLGGKYPIILKAIIR